MHPLASKKEYAWQLQNETKMKSQSRIQGEINLHKPRKKVINTSWNQNGAQMNHEQVKFIKHTIAQT